MDIKETKKLFEGVRDSLCGAYFSGSDLYVNLKANIAIIGIQTSFGSSGEDFIYIAQKKGDKVNVTMALKKYFVSGRMFPTGISKDGTKFFYTVKDDKGIFYKKEKDI